MAHSKDLEFSVNLFNSMLIDNLGYIYRGRFTQKITDSILALTESNLSTNEQSSKMKKRVYLILVEGLQNITRHQDDTGNNSSEGYGMFVIQREDEKYYITTGNLIEKKSIKHIKDLIDKINSLEKEELKEYYKHVLEEGRLSDKGGAGLGLIDMAKKSGNKLSYDFKDISEKHSYFYLHTIPSLKNEHIQPTNDKSLANIINIHQVINEKEILMISNGIFNQDSLASLLSSLENQMHGSASDRKRIYHIIFEMLDNIVKHGSQPDGTKSGNPGIFFISEYSGKYLVTTGNFIKNDAIDELSGKIDRINKMSDEELKNNKKINSSNVVDSSKYCFGITGLRKKSNQDLKYHFNKVDNNYSFFTLQVELLLN